MANTKPKALTILIPVYNGARFIGSLLDSFASFVESDPHGRDFLDACELIVLNNRSEDATLEIAQSYEERLRNLRVVTPDTHAPTTEENVFRAFKFAHGEYTWVLGCDDVVRFEAFPQVLEVAREAVYDMVVFNFMQSDNRGQFESPCNYFMKGKVWEGDLVSLTQRLGYWWLIAGFSGQIVRTSLVADYDHAALVARTSPIYSHVTAYLDCLAGRPAAIMNIQNVLYRLSDDDFQHWRRNAAKLNVFDEFFWTLGHVRQIKHLESRGIVPRDYVVRMIESNRNSFFRPTVMIYDKILSQMQLMSSTRDKRNHLTCDDFLELVEFFEQRDLLARPMFTAVRKMFDALTMRQSPFQPALEEAHACLRSYKSSFLLSANCVGIESDYEIYRLSNDYYAVHRHFRSALVERLRYLDDVELSPILLHERSRHAISTRILAVGVGESYERVPPSLMRFCNQTNAHHSTALRAAQTQLKSEYKTSNPILLRLCAWGTVQGLKAMNRLLSRRERTTTPDALQLARSA